MRNVLPSGRLRKDAFIGSITGNINTMNDQKLEINPIQQSTPQDVSEKYNDKEIIQFIERVYSESKAYRDSFSNGWLEIEQQVNCIPPDEWQEKEDWQTQVYVPTQFKISETASAVLMEMLFGQRSFYTIIGIDNDEDRKKETEIRRFIDILMERGKFFIHNEFVTQEGINLGTSFLKILVNFNRPGIDFCWKSVKDCYQDTQAIIDFNADSRYFIEEYNEDIFKIRKNSLYKQEEVDKLLECLSGKTDKSKKSDLISISNAEGNTALQISSEYKQISLREFWGELPVGDTYEWRAVTLTDCGHILRNDP